MLPSFNHLLQMANLSYCWLKRVKKSFCASLFFKGQKFSLKYQSFQNHNLSNKSYTEFSTIYFFSAIFVSQCFEELSH